MKRILLIAALLALLCGAAFAATPDEFFEYQLIDGGAQITRCTAVGDVSVPSTIYGYEVKSLARELFRGKNGIMSVTIPSTVIYFGDNDNMNDLDYVFSYCNDLKAINVEDGNPVFESVDGVLYSRNPRVLIAYPISREGANYRVPSDVDHLACTSFAEIKDLKDLYLEGVNTWWQSETFFNNTELALTVHYIPGGKAGRFAQSNGRYAKFVGDMTPPTAAPTATPAPTAVPVTPTAAPVTAPPAPPTAAPTATPTQAPTATPAPTPEEPEDPEQPEDDLISDASGYYRIENGKAIFDSPLPGSTAVVIPDAIQYQNVTYPVVSIGAYAFESSAILTSVTIGRNVKTISESAFEGCTKLKTVKGGAGVVTIGKYAFLKCRALTKLPSFAKLKSIGASAFQFCTRLTSVTLGKNVKTIGAKAFYKCSKLKKIVIKSTKLTTLSVKTNAFKGIYRKATIKVPAKKLKAYKKLLLKRGVPKTAKIKK